jgi:hypothetical protein
MRRILLTTLVLFSILVNKVNAQTRFLDVVFDSAITNPNLKYGAAVNYLGQNQDLFLDFYEGQTDTLKNRPLLILAHGGSFIQGNKAATDITKLSKELAKRGYAVASIQYRLGVNIAGTGGLTQEFTHAVWRGAQDGRAAVRFFRKSFEEGNPYGIDTSKIYVGGISAGGVLGMHMQCLDLPTELASVNVDTVAIGGIEGNSGNPGYSYRVKGVISLCGAISNVSWMLNNKNIKLISMHGTNDQTVPYASDYFKFFNSPIGFLQGGFSMDSAAQKMGITSAFHTFYGADHVPFSTNALYMDTTVRFVSKELYKQLTGLIPIGLETVTETDLEVYPNPTNHSLYINLASLNDYTYEVKSMDGKSVQKGDFLNSNQIGVSEIKTGVYILVISNDKNSISKRIIIQ